jgi:hypothetical protein
MPDSTVVAGLIGAGVMLALGAIPFFVGWGSIQAKVEALRSRIRVVEAQSGVIGKLQTDVAYIRGRLDQVLPPPPFPHT